MPELETISNENRVDGKVAPGKVAVYAEDLENIKDSWVDENGLVYGYIEGKVMNHDTSLDGRVSLVLIHPYTGRKLGQGRFVAVSKLISI